tara:strand:- start:1135 stop:1695 length:561 start_codon:yes stop_codon:yes gene_type:complete
MNPTLNKKDFDDLATNLKDLAFSYIEKYSPSKQQLKIYLMKKYLIKFRGEKTKKEVSEIINKIVENLEENSLINDEMYSDSKARSLMKRGYSLNKINQTLKIKGLEENIIKKSLEKIKENKIEPDFVSAIKLCKRRKIGASRPTPNRELFYKKDMGVLARAGFSYELSKRILEIDKSEFEKLLKII